MAQKKTLLSGIQPSGRLHIGNYFGAMRQFVELQEKYDTYISIVNYHALTTVHDGKQLAHNTLNAVIDHLAIDLDPEKTTLFLQSDVPEVTELTWVFNTLVTVPYLERGVAYKDKVAQGREATTGLLTYPVLQSADILIMNADMVPVGEDQRQHLEFTRDIAQKFNNTYGETFKLPKELIKKDVGEIVGTDGRKMHKSYGNTIPLFASREEIEKSVMSIVTDSGADIPENVYAIHKLFKTEKELEPLYEEHRGKYQALKEALIEDVEAFIAPLRKRRDEIAQDENSVREILAEGAEKARAKAQEKMREVRTKVGLAF